MKRFICAKPASSVSNVYGAYTNYINIDSIICFYSCCDNFYIVVDFGHSNETMFISEDTYRYLVSISL